MLKHLSKLEHSKSFWFLLTTLFGFFLLRLPSIFEPYWYGDEGIYEVIGFAMRHGRLLYTGIWDNKPPLLYVVYALFDGNQGGAKFLSLLVGLAAVGVFFLLSKKLFTSNNIIYITTAIFAFLLGAPLLEGNIANAENFMVLPILLAGFYIVSFLQTPEKYERKPYIPFILSGLLLGIAFLFKVVAVFDLAAFGLFTLFIINRKHFVFLPSVTKLLALGMGFIIPILLTFAYFFLHGTTKDFIHATLGSNVGYVNYGNQFLHIPQALLIFKLILLAIFSFWIFLRREKFSFSQMFIYLWLAFSIFNALFSQRPYTHYLLVLIASLSLFVGMILHDKENQRRLFAGFLVLLLFLLTNFWTYGKSFIYYGNFISFVTGMRSATDYRLFFDQATGRDYDLATFLTRHKHATDQVFIWGDDGQLYKLIGQLPLGRFIVAYHMTMNPGNITETQKLLTKHNPKFIVILPGQPAFPSSLANYSEIVIIDQAVIYERNY